MTDRKRTVIRAIKDRDDGEVYLNASDLSRFLAEGGPRFYKTARRIGDARCSYKFKVEHDISEAH